MILKAISEVFPEEVSFAIADHSRYIYYQPSHSVDLKIKPGDAIREGTVTHKALKIRQKVSQYVESDVFGVPYYGMSIPLINRGNTEGCFTVIFPRFLGKESEKLPRHHFLIGKKEDRWIPVSFPNIFFIESHNGKTLLHTEKDVYLNKYSLVELHKILPQEYFVRCHRAFFVNVNAIAEIHPDFHSTFVLVLKDQNRTRIPVSQKYASHFRKLLGF
ncbi:LytTR family DNA-binding domain-containing protein [Effusibacillus lacus]